MTTSRIVGAAIALAMALAACGGDDEGTAAGPTVGAVAKTATVKGNVATLQLTATAFEIKKADGDSSGKTGHFHVFVDRDPVAAGQAIPKEPGIIHTTETTLLIPGLTKGSHAFVVVLGDGVHGRVGSAQAQTTVTVEGPTLDATGPTTASPDEAITLSVSVTDVTLVKADGSSDPSRGHLHVFIDRDPPAAGSTAVIPKEEGIIHTADTSITLGKLAAGEHTIWVVLADGRHIPFADPIADKITITVS